MAASLFSIVIAFGAQQSTQAAPDSPPPVAQSLLPQTVGLGIPSDDAIRITFERPMDPASVAAALTVRPHHDTRLSWNASRTSLSIRPSGLWRADETYVVVIGETAATVDGETFRAPRRFAFTTQNAPELSEFDVRLAREGGASTDTAGPALDSMDAQQVVSVEPGTLSPDRTAREVSASSPIRMTFSAEMDRAETERRFRISPSVEGTLSWSGGDLMFTPAQRLELGGRYTVSLSGARDAVGNELGGKTNFSFVVRAESQLLRVNPALDARNVEPATVDMTFSHPMDVDAVNAAFRLTDTTTGRLVPGWLTWNDAETQVTYTPHGALSAGRTFEVSLAEGAVDADGNPISVSWSFSTKAAPAPVAARAATTTTAAAQPRPALPAPPVVSASGLEGYALAQVNSARAAYGRAPLALDAGLSAGAASHSWDMATRNYFGHSGRGGENICYRGDRGAQGTLDWCHAVFMAEPYPGYWNHIANILNTKWSRMGVGIATVGSRTYVTWNFAP